MTQQPIVSLVAVDMDGTFLSDAKTFDEARFDRVRDTMRARGIAFAVASGNQMPQIRTFFTRYPDTYFVSDNGALVAGPEGVLSQSLLPRPVVMQAIDTISQLPDAVLVVCGLHGARARTDANPELLPKLRFYYRDLELMDDLHDIDDEVLKLTAVYVGKDLTEDLAFLSEHLDPMLEPVSPGREFIDVNKRGVTKATGLKALGKYLGVSPDHMIAFGDGHNDLEMLKAVGHGVAMANAAPEVLAAADARTGRNNESGVLSYLERVLGL